jgi:S-adenosylmethionine:tRNA ribosyltransferase-isomerase
MLPVSQLCIDDFDYDLPEEKIAKKPLQDRTSSKLLVYQNDTLTDSSFNNIASFIKTGSVLFFNNSKVINARLFFKNDTGATIEIFCLEPADEKNYGIALSQTNTATWQCLVGNAKKWKQEFIYALAKIDTHEIIIKAKIEHRENEYFTITFLWENDSITFEKILENLGELPLPPYLKRKATEQDQTSYQTVYAQNKGSVAAPTAGLHFTPEIIAQLSAKNITQKYITLHVGAGTFLPVKSNQILHHNMHYEVIEVDIKTIEFIIDFTEDIIAVGTTSLRTLESYYWLGYNTYVNSLIKVEELQVLQWQPYEQTNKSISRNEALNSLVLWMKKNQLTHLFCKTQIMIAPGYELKIASAIITNFHQPKSTLLLLIAAIIGNNWKSNYDYALKNDYRFLSYGDSSLLYPSTKEEVK